MKVEGMYYTRSSKGEVAMCKCGNLTPKEYVDYCQEVGYDVVKASYDIEDILEEHDFVKIEYFSNRYSKRVERIFEVDYSINESICFENGYCRLNMYNGEWSNQDKELKPIIKSIVTKEQFEQIERKIQ